MRTILTIKEQNEFLSKNYHLTSISHKWSTRGMGNSKILDRNKDVIAKAGGCGYDRYGAALGNAITAMFPNEVLKLAKRECKGRSQTRKGSEKFYGLFYDKKNNRAYLDGGCGSSCMEAILNKIGFTLQYVNEHQQSRGGETFYVLTPITKQQRKWLRG